jgi:hypothetical protein
MSEIKDGGYAFPVMWTEIKSDEKGPQITACEPGMTLRDYFAAKAMQGVAMRFDLMSHAGRNDNTPDVVAKFCYQMADSMLRERGE